LWTLKEAYIKAIGKGLAHPLDTVTFRIGTDGSLTFTPPADVDARCWQFALVSPTPRHRLAVATRQDPERGARITMMSDER
jgi:4'-phosphopantetheinyl transferase